MSTSTNHTHILAPPATTPHPTLRDRLRRLLKSFTTKDGLVGTYDYAYLFRPRLPFTRAPRHHAPFFGLHARMPLLLALLLGLQHALAMLAGVITPPMLLASAASLSEPQTQYLVSSALIVSGLLSGVQITRVKLWTSGYYLGTGLISVVGTSFSVIPVATGAFAQMYSTGFCPTAEDGTKLPCPDGYGALLGTAALCALLEIGMAFLPPRALRKLFPPLVTGPTVLLIGISLVQTGFQNWAGGSGECFSAPTGTYALCPSTEAPRPLPWGSAEFVGLGFLVFLAIILCERFGSPIMKSTAVVLGLLTGCIVAGACGYFDRSGIDASPAVSFVWVHTFKLSVYGPLVLPLLAVYVVLAMEAIGDISATCDVSRLPVSGPDFDARIQGGVLADGLNGAVAALATLTPMSVFAQNNGVISLTRVASRAAGYAACFWLVVMGVFAKFAAALVAIPAPVLGGMTTFLFSAVAVSGMRIVAGVPFTRRNRFVLTAGLALGFGATLVPDWFSHVFTYAGPNTALQGFFNAIELVLQTGFAVTAFATLALNLLLPDEEDEVDEEAQEVEGRGVGVGEDEEEERGNTRGKEAEVDVDVGTERGGKGGEV